MLLAVIISILVNIIIIGLGVKLGCALLKHEISWGGALAIAGIVALASVIPYVGMITGFIALLFCLIRLANLDFWPESIVVSVVIKFVSIGATLIIYAMLKN